MQRVTNLLRLVFEPTREAAAGASAGAAELREVTQDYDRIDLAPLAVLEGAPVWMASSERLLLYALIYALRPARYLEVGSWKGGSALTVTAAMDAAGGPGAIVCVDPQPQFSDALFAQIQHRTAIVRGPSPDALPEAFAKAGGPFDFVLIDGDHSYLGAISDARGVMQYVADDAYLLVHDSHNPVVARAIDDFAAEYRDQVLDLGNLTREYIVQPIDGQPPARWFGLRLLKVDRRRSATPRHGA